MSRRLIFSGILLASMGMAPPASAITADWGGAIGAWDDPSNWQGEEAPVNATDLGRIGNGGTALYNATMNYSFGGLELGPGTGSGNMEMSGGSITTSTDVRVGGNAAATGGSGFFTMSGGSITLAGGNFNIGFGALASGTLNLSGGSILVQTSTILAVGNRGTGTVNQTGGIFQVLGNSNRAASVVQLGRNVSTGTGSGSYHLSGGSLTVATLEYGNAVSESPGSVNGFTLSGTGSLTAGTITVTNTNAVNTFHFNGGTLVTENVNIPLTNDGGILYPADLDFAGATAGNVPADATGTLTFGSGASYSQNAPAILAIDIDGPGSHDFVDIGGGAPVGNATIGGTITVSLLNGYNPVPGTFFDVLAADAITNTAAVSGLTISGNTFQASEVTGGDGRKVLRLTVVSGLAPLAIVQVGPMSGNSFPVTWASDTLSVYRVDFSMDLLEWSQGPSFPGQPSTTTYIDSVPHGTEQRFYRVTRVSP